ncbi:MAG: hypothetical protein M3362_14525, partial [Acidobacteriota bacterium]|nr:hypothetical protein [Acidobacteriota bacterium]
MVAALLPQPAEALTRELVLWSWQTILLLSCVLLLCRLLSSGGAWLRHNVWLCGLIAVALLPLWSEVSGRLRIPKLRGAAAVTPLVNLPATVGLPAVTGQDEISISFSEAMVAPPRNPLFFVYALLCASWLG